MFKRKWLVGIGVLVVFISVSSIVVFHEVRKSASEDMRAYAVDSGEISLNEALDRADINLPGCVQDDLRYALMDDGFGYYYKIYLRLEEFRECINAFLRVNAMRDVFQATEIGSPESEDQIHVRDIWMDSYPVPEMGWEFGQKERFQEFSVGTANLYVVTALVQYIPDSKKYRVYVHAFRGG
jgi:hypothetical protein